VKSTQLEESKQRASAYSRSSMRNSMPEGDKRSDLRDSPNPAYSTCATPHHTRERVTDSMICAKKITQHPSRLRLLVPRASGLQH
jgi:hypothetical protein